MPSGPSSQACDACRKQKKKVQPTDIGNSEPWDANNQELPCSRCKRLKIPCLGARQQRYRFQDESRRFEPGDQSASSVNSVILAQKPWNVQIPRRPSNEMTRLTAAFIDKVSLTDDIRYQLVGNFGGYLVQVPRRLGTNPALDAAADALVAAHTSFCSTGPTGTEGLLVKHSRALNALRRALTDPVTARSTETLGAIMLLMIVQVGRMSFDCRSLDP